MNGDSQPQRSVPSLIIANFSWSHFLLKWSEVVEGVKGEQTSLDLQ